MSLDENFAAEINETIDQMVESRNPEKVEEKKEDDIITSQNDDGTGNNSNNKNTGDNKTPATVSGAKTEDTAGLEESEAEVAETPVEIPKPTVSDYALTQAVQAGLSIEEAREFGNDKLLMRAVGLVAKNIKEVTPTQETKQEDALSLFPKLDPEKYEPEMVEAFNSLKELLKKQQEQLDSFNEYKTQTANTQKDYEVKEVETWFDKKTKELGPDLSDALGDGDYNSLTNGPQKSKRDAIATQTAILLAGYRASGAAMPPRDDIFKAAAELVLKDDLKKIQEKKIAGELEKRNKQHINRISGQKNKSEKSAMDSAVEALNAKYPPC